MGEDIKEIKEFWENCFRRVNIDFKILAQRNFTDIIERLNQYQVPQISYPQNVRRKVVMEEKR